LNVLMGGQASPRDSGTQNRSAAEPGGVKSLDVKALDVHNQELRKRHERKWREVLENHYQRQGAAITYRVPEGVTEAGKGMVEGVWYDEERWNRELFEDLLPLNLLTAKTWARLVLGALEAADVDEDVMEQRMRPWLEEHTRIQAEYINDAVRDGLETALREEDPRSAVGDLFKTAVEAWAARQAVSGVTTAQNFGAMEGAKASGLETKTWQTNSGNPRPTHAALNGVTVGIHERFPNGQRWPGDPAGGAAQNANCQCSVRFS
jgi:hypothetical protein